MNGNVLNVGNIFKQKIYQTSFNDEFPYLPRCLNCYPFIQGYSNSEKELTDFCKQYYPNLIENDRQLIKPKELDIVIPELKIAIEFNRYLLAYEI
jgi:hypothetical protein